MTSRNLRDLAPDVRNLAEIFIGACKTKGIDLLITCTYRSNEDQEALYAQGRTTPGKIATNARAGQSLHNLSINGVPAARAIDVVPLEKGKPNWDANAPVWQTIGIIGEHLGFEWAGRWKRMKEYSHFQLKEPKNV
jgi:peptidoglycan L-alanyl-D-glutamate endopeptidase CwlK